MARKNTNARKRIAAPVEHLDGPTLEQLEHGSFARHIVSDDEGKKVSPFVNTAHDPVKRWLASEKLSQRQGAAIDTVRRLWELTGLKQRLTASYGQTIGGSASVEYRALTVLEAKEDLERIRDYFPGMAAWWAVFENVCRHGWPAGVAGADLGYGTTGNEIRAHLIVSELSNIIADRERI